jgi:hypothetical protein
VFLNLQLLDVVASAVACGVGVHFLNSFSSTRVDLALSVVRNEFV